MIIFANNFNRIMYYITGDGLHISDCEAEDEDSEEERQEFNPKKCKLTN